MAANGPVTHKRNLLLTGRPGVGKTTAVIRAIDRLTHLKLAGFYTREIRESGQRRGFQATTLGGRTITLAHVNIRGRPRVGRYGVDLGAFDALAADEFSRPADLFVIDEIGKMECLSPRFVGLVRELLGGPAVVLATIAMSGGGFIAEVKIRPDVELWQVSPDNRNTLPGRLAETLLNTSDKQRV